MSKHFAEMKTFVVAFGGEVVADGKFLKNWYIDLNLLASLGVRLVGVHGARPQIESRLNEQKLQTIYVRDMQVTDAATLQCVKEVIGRVALRSRRYYLWGCPSRRWPTPPFGYCRQWKLRYRASHWCDRGHRSDMHTGEVRRVRIPLPCRSRLEQVELALLSPLGYSPTGEIFNLTLENVAAETAIALKAESSFF